MRAAPRRSRRGFTLIEVLVATMVLGGSLLGLATFAVKFARATSSSGISQKATELAVERIEGIVRTKPSYVGIDSTAASETLTGVNAGYTRTTAVTRVGGRAGIDPMDYKVVTVTVNHARLYRPVQKTVVIAAF